MTTPEMKPNLERPCTGNTVDLPKGDVCGECVNCLINVAVKVKEAIAALESHPTPAKEVK
jgi:hypothetical protein